MSRYNLIERGIINVCVIILPRADVGRNSSNSSIPERVRNEITAANNIWQLPVNGRTYGVTFKISHCITLDSSIRGVVDNAERFSSTEDAAKRLMKYGRSICPRAHVYVIYMRGNSIGPISRDGSRTNALTFIKYPLIIMCDGALTSRYVLAHELGHFLFLNNRFGKVYDPDPLKGDPHHNQSPSNLMYYRSDHWPSYPSRPDISNDQIKKALNTRFFY